MSISPAGSPDVWLLFATRSLRLFAYGCVSLVLMLYLTTVGLTGERAGLLLTMTLLGDTALSLWITTSADRVGRKWMLIAGAGLMVLGGAAFAATDDFFLLLAAATVGVISPSGNEVGPFLAIEQAALAHVVSPDRRTHVFAWYNLAGSLATAAGALACGLAVQAMQSHAVPPLQSYRAVLLAYAAAGLLLAALFTRLTPAAEAIPLTATADAAPARRGFLGLHRSRGVVLTLAALSALDAFAGGFVLQTVMASWFHDRWGADPGTLGWVFAGANLLAGFSALAAAGIARRIGLLRTMVFTHVPSNLLLILVPFMPTLESAVAVLLLRFSISQMDVPTRQAYTAAVVSPDERSAAAGLTGVARTTGAALSPALAGPLLAAPILFGGLPFVVSGVLKLAYDGLLYRLFRRATFLEEGGPGAPGGAGK
jgi:MFS family permease